MISFIHEFKMKLIKDNINKLGVKIVTPMVMDASKQEFNQQFDFILIDAPCSGLGVTLHKPDLKYRMTLDKIKEIKETQFAILNNMCKYWYIIYFQKYRLINFRCIQFF